MLPHGNKKSVEPLQGAAASRPTGPDNSALRSRSKTWVAQAAIEGLDQKRVENAVTLYTEVSFQERAETIVREISDAIPEITESISDFPRRIKRARNALAHHLTGEAEKPIETRALEWLVVAEAISWLLRALLLLRVGIDPQVLRQRFLDFQRFGFFRANTAQHVRELGWELPTPPSG